MVSGDRISGVVCLIFSLVAVIASYHLGVGTTNSPQSGFFPFLVSIVLVIFSVALLIGTIKHKHKLIENSEGITFKRQRMPKVIFIVVSIVFYAIFLNTLGFILTTIIQIGSLLGVMGALRKHVVIILAILIGVIAYIIFDVGLGVQLPKGFLGF